MKKIITKTTKGHKTRYYFLGKLIFKFDKKWLYLLDYMLLIKNSIADPKGMGHLELLLEYTGVADKYKHIFMSLTPFDTFIDCGAHTGKVTDIALHMGVETHSFEPNKTLYQQLDYKYRDVKHSHIYNMAVWDKETVMSFTTASKDNHDFYNATQGGSLIIKQDSDNFKTEEVNVVNLLSFIDNLLKEKDFITVLKLDVEGAEFEILEKLITGEYYERISYIFCETHAPLVENGRQRLSMIEQKIQEKQIKNIYLDWS